MHGDICGPITLPTPAGNRYFFMLVVDHSHVMWTFMLKTKDEAFDYFKKFRALAENKSREKLLTFRTDREGEFLSKRFEAYCQANGIKRHLTAPYSPQQNGIVERRNRTMVEMARSLLKEMSLPAWLLGEAIRHATLHP